MALGNQEREARAARNESLFRKVNERMQPLNEDLSSSGLAFTVACECCNTECFEMLELEPSEYSSVRANPRRFLVKPGHVASDVDDVVREAEQYVVVEKRAAAGAVAEELAGTETAS